MSVWIISTICKAYFEPQAVLGAERQPEIFKGPVETEHKNRLGISTLSAAGSERQEALCSGDAREGSRRLPEGGLLLG